MSAVFKREFKSYFQTPIGFIVLSVYYFFLGLYFSLIYSYGSTNIDDVILMLSSVAVFTVPVITMRLFSDDRKQKVDQVLFTAPVKITAVVLGKFFAAFCLFALCFAPTVIYEIIIVCYVKTNIAVYLYSLFGMLLLGAALVAIGMFISSLTESVVVSAVIAIIINILVLYANSVASVLNIGFITKIASKIAFLDVLSNFSTQLFSLPDVVYFLSITAGFVFLTVRSIEKRRWA